jgi:glycosyltransferase involved in cell wall biosynthesis
MRAGLFEPGVAPEILTFHAARELLPAGLAAAITTESRLAALPGIRQVGHDPGRWRYLLPLMPRYFRSLDLSGHDVVISSSHACALHVRPAPEALHVCYCYTPMRYAWSPETDGRRVSGLRGLALHAAASRLREQDRLAAQRPDAFIAISEAVQERIRRHYGRDSAVVHPPVETTDLAPGGQKEEGRFLWVHRLVSYKRPEVVAEAFRGLPYTLTMVGVGPLEKSLRDSLPPNVELRGWLSRQELVSLYERSSGFIHVGEEDFGITMVEALAAGTPVIALDRGGSRDIVRDGIDGHLVGDPDVESLRSAIREMAVGQWDPSALAERAADFSTARFLDRLAAAVENARATKAARG